MECLSAKGWHFSFYKILISDQYLLELKTSMGVCLELFILKLNLLYCKLLNIKNNEKRIQ